MQAVSVYGLMAPSGEAIRYIGVAKDASRRLKRHIGEASRFGTRKQRWLASLSGRPRMVVLDNEVGYAEAFTAEIIYILVFRMCGCDLTNGTRGGDGLTDPNPEVREKISLKNSGKPMTAANKEKLKERMRGTQRHLGYTHTTAARARMSEAHKGRRSTPAHRLKVSLALTGRAVSEATRSKLSLANTGRKFAPLSATTRASMARGQQKRWGLLTAEERAAATSAAKLARIGSRHSDETREKMRNAWVVRKRLAEGQG